MVGSVIGSVLGCPQQGGLDTGIEHGLPRYGGIEGAPDVVSGRVFGQVPGGAGREGGHDGLVVGVGGQDHDGDLGMLGPDRLRRLHPVLAGHAQVHQHDVGLRGPDELDRLDAVLGQPDHLGVGETIDDGRQTFAHDALVVGDQDLHACTVRSPATGSSGTTASTRQPSVVGPTSTWPPRRATRSAMPRKP